mmetsp:Transcript_9037/g.16811  ORF Transcript_9037/g.16811 Transcript_9037/m.16811 type:complete len:235 (+) Transcript_9037:2559-3263(+)
MGRQHQLHGLTAQSLPNLLRPHSRLGHELRNDSAARVSLRTKSADAPAIFRGHGPTELPTAVVRLGRVREGEEVSEGAADEEEFGGGEGRGECRHGREGRIGVGSEGRISSGSGLSPFLGEASHLLHLVEYLGTLVLGDDFSQERSHRSDVGPELRVDPVVLLLRHAADYRPPVLVQRRSRNVEQRRPRLGDGGEGPGCAAGEETSRRRCRRRRRCDVVGQDGSCGAPRRGKGR